MLLLLANTPFLYLMACSSLLLTSVFIIPGTVCFLSSLISAFIRNNACVYICGYSWFQKGLVHIESVNVSNLLLLMFHIIIVLVDSL